MQARNPSDDELWESCRKLPSDWEPHGQRKWLGRREARPDCATCRWFLELFHTAPDWGACSNPESARAGLLTNWEQGCWQHEPQDGTRHEQVRRARCGFKDYFERVLREEAAEFVHGEVGRANDLLPEEEPPAPIRKTFLLAILRRLLRHANEDFRRQAFDELVARARKDTRRHWESARCRWGRTVGEDVSEIRLPENMRHLEEKFWGRVDATIREALEGRVAGPRKKKREGAG